MRRIKYGSRVMEFYDGNDATLLCYPSIPTSVLYTEESLVQILKLKYFRVDFSNAR